MYFSSFTFFTEGKNLREIYFYGCNYGCNYKTEDQRIEGNEKADELAEGQKKYRN